jgi:ribose transport system permease protein
VKSSHPDESSEPPRLGGSDDSSVAGGGPSLAAPVTDAPLLAARDWLGYVSQYGVIAALVVATLIFSLIRPEAFLTTSNFRSILASSAPLAILAVGLTVVLVMQQFDLSIGAMVGLSSSIVVVLMTTYQVNWPVAALVALGAGLLVGLLNGALIAYAGTPSFITTLAMGTTMTGVEFMVTGQRSIFQPLPDGFLKLGGSRPLWEVNSTVLFAGGVAILGWLLLEKTEVGRYMRAVGANPEAARLSGLQVRSQMLAGFVIVAFSAALVGVLISSRTSAYTPNSGTAYLLPTFAAAFLGAATGGRGRFNVTGTVVGVLLLGVIRTGLTMMQFSTDIVKIVQGTILIGAMLLTRVKKR